MNSSDYLDSIFTFNSTTLKKSERGEISPIELISKPSIIMAETDFRENQPSVVHYPWDKSQYKINYINWKFIYFAILFIYLKLKLLKR